MKQNAYVLGVGITRFGKHLDKGLKELAIEAIDEALRDAGLETDAIEAAYMGNAAASVITGQVCIAGQAVLRTMGVGRIPVINVENACATSSTAFEQACTMVTTGVYDVVLAAGYEKLYHADKARTFSVFTGCIDVEDSDAVFRYLEESAGKSSAAVELAEAGKSRSVFMDIYASWARQYMKKTGATAEHFAMVSAKNSRHGARNPNAQFRNEMTVEEVLSAPMIADPLTLPMCSPIGDGAAAAIVVSEQALRRLGARDAIRVQASLIASGYDYTTPGMEPLAAWAASQIYEEAGIGPADLSCVELHDASSPAELQYYEHLGLCPKGDGVRLLEEGATELGGRIPVNTSGGLNRKGHPIGATGLGQIHELTLQLRGQAGARQVEGAKVALAENGGGFIGQDGAAMVMTVLMR
jgi:acetyl-CoA acetyltransferase